MDFDALTRKFLTNLKEGTNHKVGLQNMSKPLVKLYLLLILVHKQNKDDWLWLKSSLVKSKSKQDAYKSELLFLKSKLQS